MKLLLSTTTPVLLWNLTKKCRVKRFIMVWLRTMLLKWAIFLQNWMTLKNSFVSWFWMYERRGKWLIHLPLRFFRISQLKELFVPQMVFAKPVLLDKVAGVWIRIVSPFWLFFQQFLCRIPLKEFLPPFFHIQYIDTEFCPTGRNSEENPNLVGLDAVQLKVVW